jgi:hypothetical protein
VPEVGWSRPTRFADLRDALGDELVVPPECQRTPVRTLPGPASGSTVTSVTRTRSRRLRSRSLVVGAGQSVGRLATAASSSALSGSGLVVALASARAASAIGQLSQACLEARSEVAGYEPVSGSTTKSALSARPDW